MHDVLAIGSGLAGLLVIAAGALLVYRTGLDSVDRPLNVAILAAALVLYLGLTLLRSKV